MSIASITTLGYGSFSTVNLAVAFGFGAGTASAKHGGDDAWIDRKSAREHRAWLKRQEEALQAREDEKLAQRAALRAELEEGFNPTPPPDDAAAEPLVTSQAQPVTAAARIDLQARLQEVETHLAAIHGEMGLRAAEARRMRDEDDMQAILAAMSIN